MKSRLHRWLPSALPFLLAACASTNEPAGPPLLPPPPVVASAPAAPRAAQAPSPTASRASEAQLTVAQRREIFEAAWSRLAELHFDPALGGVDWKAVHEKTAPKVDGCKDDDALLEVLNDMCAALGHSHVAVMPPEGAEERDIEKSLAALPATEDREEKRASAEAELFGDTGIRASAIEDGIVVVSVAAGSPAEKAGIRVGDAIEAIGDLSSQRLLSLAKGHHVDPTGRGVIPYVVQARLTGNVGTRAKLTVSRAGEKRELEVERVAPDVPPVRFGTLGAMHADFEKRTLPGGVLYVRFSPCFARLQEKVEEALDDSGDAAGVVLDLRHNPGGLGFVATGVSRLFIDADVDFGTMRMRKGEIHFRVNPEKKPYAGPLAVLVDASSASTSEIMAGGLQFVGRARIVGETSMGAALPSIIEKLPHEWRLQAVIADFRLPDGSLVEGRGVIPDVVVVPTRADLAAGRDPALDAAVRDIEKAPTLASLKRGAAAEEDAAPASHAALEATPEAIEVMEKMVEAIGGADAVLRRKTSKSISEMELSAAGIKGTITMLQAMPDRMRSETKFPGVTDSLTVLRGDRAVSQDTVQGTRELKGEELAFLQRSSRLDAAAAWRELFAKVEIVERKREGERDVIVVRTTPHAGEGQPATTYVDAATYLPFRVDTTVKMHIGNFATTSEVLEYVEIDGVKEAKRTITTAPNGLKFETHLVSRENNVPIDESTFEFPVAKKTKKKAKKPEEATATAPAGDGG